MSDTSLNKIIQYGTAAARVAFVPTPAAGSKVLYIWYDTDVAPNTYIWNGAAWVQINSGGGGSSTTSRYIVSTTEAGLPNSSVLVAGAGISVSGTTGTTTVRNTSTTQEYVLATTSTTTTPNSRVLTAGSGIVITTTTGIITISASGGGGWTFVTTAAASGTTVDFIGLGGYSEIMIIMKGVTATGNCIRQLLVSTNNGSTFLNASGNYINLDSNGAETNSDVLSFDNGNNAASHSGWLIISAFNNTQCAKPVTAAFPAANLVGLVNTTSALSAIRAQPHANSFNGGNFFVFGR